MGCLILLDNRDLNAPTLALKASVNLSLNASRVCPEVVNVKIHPKMMKKIVICLFSLLIFSCKTEKPNSFHCKMTFRFWPVTVCKAVKPEPLLNFRPPIICKSVCKRSALSLKAIRVLFTRPSPLNQRPIHMAKCSLLRAIVPLRAPMSSGLSTDKAENL